MNALRNIFSSRAINYLRQNGQNALINVTQPAAVEATAPSTTGPTTLNNDARTGQSSALLIPRSIIDACTFTAKSKFERINEQNSGNISPTTLKNFRRMQRKVELVYRCKLCNTRNTKIVSEAAYTSGVVILQCDGCAVDHLIIDNVGWFANTKAKNIEEVLAERADRVRIIKVNEHGEII